MKVIDAHRIRSKVEYECPACGCRLERCVSNGESRLVLAGCMALFFASGLSVLGRIYVLQAPRAVIVLLYALAAVVGLVEIRNEFVRKRFYVSPEI